MKFQLNHVALLCSAWVLAGCSTQIKDFASFRQAELEETEVMPTKKQMEQTRVRVIVMRPTDTSSDVKNLNLGSTLASKLESVIAQGGAEIVDRSLAAKMEKEVRLIESTGKGNYKGPEVANYVVSAELMSARICSERKEREEIPSKKGKPQVIPAHTVVMGTVKGVIKVYELPNMKQVVSKEFFGGKSSQTDFRASERSIEQIGRGHYPSAIEEGIGLARHEMLNAFAPKGYVTEKRMHDGKTIFKVMLGKKLGVTPELDVTFMRLRPAEDPMTKQKYNEELVLGEGTVSDQVGEDFSWVVPKSSNLAKDLKRGDIVRVIFKKGVMDSVGGLGGAIKQLQCG